MFVTNRAFLTAVIVSHEPFLVSAAGQTLAVCVLELLSPGISEVRALNVKTHEVSNSVDGNCFDDFVSAVLETHYPFD